MPAFPKFKTIITDYGKQRLIAAMSPGGTKLTLTQMAVGDGGGNPTNPDTTSTALVNEVWRAAVNSVSVDKTHSNIIIVELLIPAEVGGFWVREAGIYDEFNKLVAICSLPASEKPLLEQGSGRAQTVRMTLIVSDTSIVNITIDSTTIMATNEYVDNSLEEHEKSRNHPDATLTDKGFTKLYSGVTSIDETMAATPKAVKIAMDNASARLAKERNLADLTNIPLARQSLQLGNSATLNVGTTANTVAAGDDSRITGAMQKSQNGGDIPDKKKFARTIGAVTSTNITFNDASGWYKIATVVMPQSTSTAVIKLYGGSGYNVGSFEQAAISELVLRAGNGSPVGITATLWRRSPAAANEVAWVNTSGDTYDIYINIGQHAYWLIAQYDYTGNANVTLHSTPEYSSVQPGSSTSGQTYTLYNSLMKPTAGDVEALSVNGGRLNGALGIGTDNALGGNSIVFGDNDTGFKWHSDGVLGIYANNALVGYIDNSGLHMSVDVLSNGAIRAGNAKKLSLTSNNNSTMTATFNLWGDANRPTVIELDDDQGWHLYSQRNPDGSIVFTVNGDITANTLRAGEAIYQNNGDIFGSAWGGWLSNWINNNFVRAVRLGPQAISGGLWRDYQLGGGNVVTGFHTDGSWEMEGDDDKVYYRPVQFLVGGTWITASSV
ncbi:phage tail protein [Salmonella enterica subsp. enterica serovar Miami]|uniref:Phage tail protein n=13 Tax=Salmonella enterica TaxID=28901 RepID=A0A8E6U2R5_SALET|nr:phage tail protein [Salmonella enterica]EBE4006773.1 phage tail protein [Salmonella enterica subsp. enterica serovar Muenchen]EBM0749260.1 phage tail protein [Salmonella enterica subsp. enterica serovar Give]EBV0971126.1 phage tail protein [Salmonella enterica subsp. enterica serovar Miami]EBX8641232.1 phage tail protein [Salmonella enterica subsp. enterica serovar Litchfield]ECE0914010.1 phage tail protein [Salmonella enterica subsp. enterica]ECX3446825.1 phage tail protein [Salmonella en